MTEKYFHQQFLTQKHLISEKKEHSRDYGTVSQSIQQSLNQITQSDEELAEVGQLVPCDA